MLFTCFVIQGVYLSNYAIPSDVKFVRHTFRVCENFIKSSRETTRNQPDIASASMRNDYSQISPF